MTSAFDNSAGFTLIEALIGIVLSAVLLTILFGSLNTYLQAGQRTAATIDARARTTAPLEFLRAQISQTIPLATTEGGEARILFRGESKSLSLISEIPLHLDTGGPMLNTFSVERSSTGERIVFAYRHLPPGSDWGFQDTLAQPIARQKTILSGLTGTRFEYFGPKNDISESRWHNAWPNELRLPDLIRVSYETEKTPRSEMVVAPKAQFTRLSETLIVSTDTTRKNRKTLQSSRFERSR